MRPLLLNITGVKSICEKQSIDFESLSKSGIFGIFGRTGSGKSTILDSMVLALYGGVVGKGEKANFVNVDSKLAEVELVFSANVEGKDRTYRVIRVYKFDGARKNLKSDANLWEITKEGEIPVAEGVKPVDECIKKQIIGLEKEDFLKCIALPQGEFSAFVKMTRGDRLKVIGKLFNLQKYGKELYDKVLAKDKELGFKELEQSGKLSGLGDINEEYFELIGKEYERIKKEAEQKKAEADEARLNYDRAKTLSQLVNERDEKGREIAQKSAYKPVIESFEGEIKEFDKGLLLKGVLQNRDSVANGLKGVNAKIKQLEAQKAERKIALDLATEKLLQCEKLEEEHKSLIERRAGIVAIENVCSQLKDKEARLLELREVFQSRSARIKRIEEDKQRFTLCIAEIDESLKTLSVDLILQRVSEGVASARLNQILGEHLQFLSELSAVIGELLKGRESVVNGLIATQIEKTKELLSTQNSQVEVVVLLDEAIAGLKKNTMLNNQRAELCAKRESDEKLLSVLVEEQSRDERNGKQIRKECDALLAEQKKALGDLTYEVALRAVNEEIAKIQSLVKERKLVHERAQLEFANVNEQYAKLIGEREQLTESLSGLESQLSQGLSNSSLTLDGLRSILSKERQIQDSRALVESFYRQLHALTVRVEEINKLLSDAPVEYFNFELFEQNYKNCTQNLEEINKKFGEISKTYEMGLKNYEKWCIISANIKNIKQERSLYGQLIKLVENNLFMEYIAEEYLKDIAHIAEGRVLELTNGKFGLLYQGEEFFVKDYVKGGIIRPVSGLSGGETFLVSLSLALALSNQIIKKAVKPINFFFLDEGFGTLDDELINTVTDSLEKLRQSNLTVGLITHVGELKNRIQSKLYVEGATASHGTIITQSF